MPPSRFLQSVLWNFLGTFTSRYTDIDGYWGFGFLVPRASPIEFSLLATADEGARRTRFADGSRGAITEIAGIARTRFREQLAKNGAQASEFRDVTLRLEFPPQMVENHVGQHSRLGYEVVVRAEATDRLGRKVECSQALFVAPHDPSIELRSSRRN